MLPAPRSLDRPWTEAYPPGVPLGYRAPDVPVTRFLDDAARDFPTGRALVHAGASWTWTELVTLVDRVAARLVELGTGAGDVVAVVSAASPPTVVAQLAAWRVGAVVAAVDAALDDEALGARLRVASPDLVVTGLDRLDAVQAARPGLAACRHVLVADLARWSGRRARVLAGVRARVGVGRQMAPEDDVVPLDDVLARRQGRPRVRQHPVPSDATVLLAWSSLAAPDGAPVPLSRSNLVAATFQARLWVPDARAGREVLLGGVGPGHVQGLVTGVLWGLLAAATLVLVDHPDGEGLVEAVAEHGVSVLALHPEQAAALTRASGSSRADLGTVRVALAVGAPLGPGVRLPFEEATEGRLRQAYGCTAAAGLTHAMPIYGRIRDATIGLPVTDTVAAVRALSASPGEPGEDVLVGPGEVGELVVAGPQVATSLTDDQGWLATGDLAAYDADGVFRLLGPVRDAVVRDGARVLPTRVEEALLEHPAVHVAAVVATASDRVEAAVVPGRRRVRADRLLEHLGQLLEPDQLPDELHLLDSLPRTSVGTIDRPALRALLAARDEGTGR